MQPKHVSEHVWNGEKDRKLHIRRVVPTYQGEEQITEQNFPFLQQSFATLIYLFNFNSTGQKHLESL